MAIKTMQRHFHSSLAAVTTLGQILGVKRQDSHHTETLEAKCCISIPVLKELPAASTGTHCLHTYMYTHVESSRLHQKENFHSPVSAYKNKKTNSAEILTS